MAKKKEITAWAIMDGKKFAGFGNGLFIFSTEQSAKDNTSRLADQTVVKVKIRVVEKGGKDE